MFPPNIVYYITSSYSYLCYKIGHSKYAAIKSSHKFELQSLCSIILALDFMYTHGKFNLFSLGYRVSSAVHQAEGRSSSDFH